MGSRLDFVTPQGVPKTITDLVWFGFVVGDV